MKGGVSVAGLLAVLSTVLLVARQSQAISCGDVSNALVPCVPCLTSGGPPSSSCCSGVRSLNSMAATQQDRRAACNCVKDAAKNYPNLKPDAASSLPSRCGVSVNIPISPSVDCNKYYIIAFLFTSLFTLRSNLGLIL